MEGEGAVSDPNCSSARLPAGPREAFGSGVRSAGGFEGAVGGFGRCQRLLCALTFLPLPPLAFALLSGPLLTLEPPHHCPQGGEEVREQGRERDSWGCSTANTTAAAQCPGGWTYSAREGLRTNAVTQAGAEGQLSPLPHPRHPVWDPCGRGTQSPCFHPGALLPGSLRGRSPAMPLPHPAGAVRPIPPAAGYHGFWPVRGWGALCATGPGDWLPRLAGLPGGYHRTSGPIPDLLLSTGSPGVSSMAPVRGPGVGSQEGVGNDPGEEWWGTRSGTAGAGRFLQRFIGHGIQHCYRTFRHYVLGSSSGFYLMYLLSAGTGGLACLFLCMTVDRCGRRAVLLLAMTLTGLASLILLGLTAYLNDATILVLCSLGLFSSQSVGTLSIFFCSELIPTVVRGLGLGLILGLSWMGELSWPILELHRHRGYFLHHVLYASLALLGCLCILLLPESKRKPLPDNLHQGEIYRRPSLTPRHRDNVPLLAAPNPAV